MMKCLSFSIRIQSEYESLSLDGRTVIGRFGNLRNFLTCDENITIIDDYICVKSDTETAQKLAINRVMKHPMYFGQITKPVTTSNAWFNKSLDNSESLVDSIPSLQLPEMDSLFQRQVNPIRPPSPPVSTCASVIIPNSFPVPPPSQDSSPENFNVSPTSSNVNTSIGNLIQVPTSFSTVCTSTASTINTSLSAQDETSTKKSKCLVYRYDTASAVTTEENLHKKLQALTLANAELMTKLDEKDRYIQSLVKLQLVDPKYDLLKRTLSLEKELLEARVELKEWKQKAEKSRDSSQLVISLQKQLESEKLNSRNLKHQVEMERIYSNKIHEKYSNLMKQIVLTPPPSSSASTNNSISCSLSSSLNSPKSSLDSSYPLSSIWNPPKSESTPSRLTYSSSTGLPSRKFTFPPPNPNNANKSFSYANSTNLFCTLDGSIFSNDNNLKK